MHVNSNMLSVDGKKCVLYSLFTIWSKAEYENYEINGKK